MWKKDKKILISILIIILIFLSLFIQKNSCEFLISLNFQYKSLKDVDENWGLNFEREFLKISSIKEVFVFSYPNKCEIYLKISPFALNKSKTIEKITLKTYSLLNNLNYNNEKIEIDFDSEYGKKFDYFFVVSFLDDDFEKFFDFENKYLVPIFNSTLITRLKVFPKIPFASYIYFEYDVLKKFALDLGKIKEIINNNNINFNIYYPNSDKSSFLTNISSDIDNLSDIKNIVIPFREKSFGLKLQDIFEVKNGFFDFNNSKIISKNKNSIIYAFNKPFFIPDFAYFPYLEKKLNQAFKKENFNKDLNFKTDLIKTNSLEKTVLNSSDELILNDFDSIYFIGQKSPKISSKNEIEEFDSNNIVILSKKGKNNDKKIKQNQKAKIFLFEDDFRKNEAKIDEILKKNGQNSSKIDILLTKSEKMIFKKIDNFSLNDYQISKNELINSLIASGEGLFLDYYQNRFYKIPVILKNKNKNSSPFVYSKDSDILYDSNSFLTSGVKNNYSQITRKNGKILTIVKILK